MLGGFLEGLQLFAQRLGNQHTTLQLGGAPLHGTVTGHAHARHARAWTARAALRGQRRLALELLPHLGRTAQEQVQKTLAPPPPGTPPNDPSRGR